MMDLLELTLSTTRGRVGLIASGLSGLAGGVLGLRSGIRAFQAAGALLAVVGLALVLLGVSLKDPVTTDGRDGPVGP